MVVVICQSMEMVHKVIQIIVTNIIIVEVMPVPKEIPEANSIQDMISLLREYQQLCLSKQDFASANEAKTKIELLRSQDLLLKQEQLESQDKENIEFISKKGEEEIRLFQTHWDKHLQDLIEDLKRLEHNLDLQHQQQLSDFVTQLDQESPPKMKFSALVLNLRIHLRNLIKTKNYKQAETIKLKLECQDQEELSRWKEKVQLKKKNRLQALKKRQLTELNALRIKAETSFNQSIKQRDQKFQILLKKNRKRRIQSGKISRERLKAKTALLNQSKSLVALAKH